MLTDTGGVLVSGAEVLGFEFRVVVDNLLFGHPRGQPVQDVPNRDAKAANARLARTFPRLDGDTRFDSCRIAPA
jgi:hypothetical protein